MKRITAIIERAKDGTYCIYCKDEIFSGLGDSIEDAKKDMEKQMNTYKETAIKEGFKYPDYLDSGYTIDYHVDAASLLQYFIAAGIFTFSSMEKITGISQKQLWAYNNGTKPRKAQADRINAGLEKLAKDLEAIYA